jgi:hypothetical protein
MQDWDLIISPTLGKPPVPLGELGTDDQLRSFAAKLSTFIIPPLASAGQPSASFAAGTGRPAHQCHADSAFRDSYVGVCRPVGNGISIKHPPIWDYAVLAMEQGAGAAAG